MIIFTLARLLQASLQLATLAAPTNKSIYIAVFILLGIAVSPLELTTLGLLSRLISNINRTRQTLITTRHIQLVQLVNAVGLILSIIGGNQSGESFGNTGQYTPKTLTKVGLALFIVSYVAILLSTAYLATQSKFTGHGEHRVLIAVVLSLPFMLVRIIYSSVGTFGGVHKFSLLGGSETILLCMGLLMEFCIVAVYEGIGVTLKKVIPAEDAIAGHTNTSEVNPSFVTKLREESGASP